MFFLYQVFVQLLIFGMKVFSLFNDKTKKGIEGRKQSSAIVHSAFSASDQIIWMHAASLGEYEQGLPVLEKLKAKYPTYKILVTFFSPSGYDNVLKKKTIADAICYLPFDTKIEITSFLEGLNIQLFFTVKYDYWYLLLQELKKRKAKTFVISALFYEKQSFFRTYGKWFVKQLKANIDWFFHQTPHSFALAKSIGLEKSSITGDTRFDRVKDLKARDNNVPFMEEFIADKKSIVLGSSWQAEEKIAKLIEEKNSSLKIIIAPHDLKRVFVLKELFPNAILYSEIEKTQNLDAQILIIDCIGLLSKLYSYADIAIVGGGFHTSGLHNILEAATFGKPVLFGNQYKKNPEADDLISAKGGQSFENETLAAQFAISLLHNEEKLHTMSRNAEKFVFEKPNASNLIVKRVELF